VSTKTQPELTAPAGVRPDKRTDHSDATPERLRQGVARATGVPLDALRPEEEICRAVLGPTAQVCPRCGACYLGYHDPNCGVRIGPADETLQPPPKRHRGGDRRAMQLQPRRFIVVRQGKVDVLECGHELENPWRNRGRWRHCPECPPLAEPMSEVARLRLELEGARIGAQIDGRALAQQHAEISRLRRTIESIAWSFHEATSGRSDGGEMLIQMGQLAETALAAE